MAIVGAGAAGIAAARRCLSAGLSVGIYEAGDRVGGRAVTALFGGHPIDLGAHWLHAGAVNPLVRIARAQGEPLFRSLGDGPVLTGRRFGGCAERRGYGRAFQAMDRAIGQAAREGPDRPLSAIRPPLGRWRAPIESTFALVSGRPLREVSAQDFPSEEFGDNYFVRGGYGAFLARLADALPVALSCPVDALDWSGSGVSLRTAGGAVLASAAIVTVPLPLLASGAIAFRPALPLPLAEAIGAFLPGAYEHVVLNWPDSPFREPDRLAKIVGPDGSTGLLTCMDGAPFHYMEFGDVRATELNSKQLRALARDILRETFGARALHRARVIATTSWLRDPLSGCAWAVAPPGRSTDREALARPVGERIWLAGEAGSRAQWGTVGGAWAEGERAADEIAARLGARGRMLDGDGPRLSVPDRAETP